MKANRFCNSSCNSSCNNSCSNNSFPIPINKIILKYNRRDEIIKNQIFKNKIGCYVYIKNVSNINSKNHLFKDLNFYLKPKEMTLVIGSGSSSVINLLAGLFKEEDIRGTMLFNGHKLNRYNHHRDISLIGYQDLHLPLLTIKETLRFALDCQVNNNEIADDFKEIVVNNELKLADLYDIRDKRISNDLDIAQKRKLTVLNGLIKSSGLILCDQITNGLDSDSSLNLIKLIKNNVDYGYSSALITLQQPSVQIASLFTNLIILSKGQICYFGPMSNALGYFEQFGFECPPHRNPAEFFQEVIESPIKFSTINPPLLQTSEDFIKAYQSSNEYQELLNEMDNHNNGIMDNNIDPNQLIDASILNLNKYPNQFTYQTKICLKRSLTMMIREKYYLYLIFHGLFFGLLLGSLFFRIGNHQKNAIEKPGVMFFVMIYIVVMSNGTIGLFYKEKGIFQQQRNKYHLNYNTLPYFISNVISNLIPYFINTWIFSALVYWMININTSGYRYFCYFLLLTCLSLFQVSYTKFCSIFASNIEVSFIIFNYTIPVLMLLSGFAKPRVKGWWIWLHILSPFTYSFHGLSVNNYIGQSYYCQENEYVPPLEDPLLYKGYPEGYEGNRVCPKTTGKDFIVESKIYENNGFQWICMAIIFGYALLFYILAFIGLRFLKFSNQNQNQNQNQHKNHIHHYRHHQQNYQSVIDINYSNLEYLHSDSYLEFKNIYYIFKRKKKKQLKNNNCRNNNNDSLQILLKDINGYIKSGEMLAIIGPSGCGKTKLLKVLAKRKKKGVSGEISLYNNNSTNDYNQLYCFIDKLDSFIPVHRVREIIEFNANCKLNYSKFKKEDRRQFIEIIIQLLNINDISNLKIGTLDNGLSASQRKRLSIGIGLASNPSVLFLQEPTTGLPASESLKLILDISNICKLLNKTVIVSLHQPTSSELELFNSLLLLNKGEPAYFGPIGKDCKIVLDYFKQFGFQIKRYIDPSNFILSILNKNDSINHNSKFNSTKQYKQSIIYKQTVKQLEYGIFQNYNNSINNNNKNNYLISWIKQFKLIFIRSFKSRIRKPNIYLANFIRSFFFSIFFGTLFIRMGYQQYDARARVSFFNFSFFFGTMVCSGNIPHITLEKKNYIKECVSNLYCSSAYLLGFILSSIPFSIANSVIFIVPSFFLANFDAGPHSSQFWYCVFIYILTFIMYDVLSISLAFSIPNERISQLVCTSLVLLAVLFAGFLVTKPSIENGYIWVHYLDFLSYSLEGVSVNEFNNLQFYCPDNQGATQVPLGNGLVKYYCPITDGIRYLKKVYGMNLFMRYINIAPIITFIFIFTSITFISIIKLKQINNK